MLNRILDMYRNHKNHFLDIALLSVVCCILGLFVEPSYMHPDHLVRRAFTTLRQYGHPPIFKYPGFIMYLYTVVYGGVLCVMYLAGTAGSPIEVLRAGLPLGTDLNQNLPIEILPSVHIPLYLPGYFINVAFSILAIACLYLLLLRLTERRSIALVGGAFCATAYLWLKGMNHLTGDLPVGVMTLLTVFVVLRFTDRQKPMTVRQVILLGVLIGLTASTKPSGAMVAAAVCTATVFCYSGRRGLMIRHLALMGGISLLTYLLTNPFLFVGLEQIAEDYQLISTWHKNGAAGYVQLDHTYLRHVTRTLVPMYGAFSLGLAVAGCIIFLFWRSYDLRTRLTLLAFPVVYYVVTGKSVYGPSRYMFTMVPYLALFGGFAILFMITVLQKLFERFGRSMHRYVEYGLIAAVFLVSVSPGFSSTLDEAGRAGNGNTIGYSFRAIRDAGFENRPLRVMARRRVGVGLAENNVNFVGAEYCKLWEVQERFTAFSLDSLDLIVLHSFDVTGAVRIGLDEYFSRSEYRRGPWQVIQFTPYHRRNRIRNGSVVEICSADTSIIGRITRSCERNALPYSLYTAEESDLFRRLFLHRSEQE